jgi:hypothetical protein
LRPLLLRLRLRLLLPLLALSRPGLLRRFPRRLHLLRLFLSSRLRARPSK